MAEPIDDLDKLLTPPPAGPGEAALREAVRRRTGRVVARRRWVRRGKALALAAVLFAGGGAAGWFARPTPDAPAQVREFVAVPVPVVLPPVEPTPPASEGSSVTAERLEVQAELAGDAAQAAELYRRAGDRYLADRGDSAQAARCYRLFLLRAGPDARAVAPDDSWLLIALKIDQKEASRVPNEGL